MQWGRVSVTDTWQKGWGWWQKCLDTFLGKASWNLYRLGQKRSDKLGNMWNRVLGALLISFLVQGCFLIPTNEAEYSSGGGFKKPLVAKSVSAGGNTSCAIDPNNNLWCWGDGSTGKLLDMVEDVSEPIQIKLTVNDSSVGWYKDYTKFVQVKQSDSKICAQEAGSGHLVCWGRWFSTTNTEDVKPKIIYLGNTLASPSESAMPIQFSSFDLGQGFGCGVVNNGKQVICFGYSNEVLGGLYDRTSVQDYNQGLIFIDLNNLEYKNNTIKAELEAASLKAHALSNFQVSNQNACVTMQTKLIDETTGDLTDVDGPNKLICWGATSFTQIGGVVNDLSLPPMSIVNESNIPLKFKLTPSRLCVLWKSTTPNTETWKCRGAVYGNQGNDTSSYGRSSESGMVMSDWVVANSDLGSDVLTGTTSAILNAGSYQVSAATNIDYVVVEENLIKYVEAFKWFAFGCRIDGGKLLCHGNPSSLGGANDTPISTGRIGSDESPSTADDWVELSKNEVLGRSKSVKQFALGIDHGCMVTTEGYVHCWGSNHSGQLGIGETENYISAVPKPVQMFK